MNHTILLADGKTIDAKTGDNLLDILRQAGELLDAPCGGNGVCGKCKVKIDGKQFLACQYEISSDINVEISSADNNAILSAGKLVSRVTQPSGKGFALAFDIGTTTVVCYLLNPAGEEIAVESMLNPQVSYGADVITRIKESINGKKDILEQIIRNGMIELIFACCRKANISPDEISVVSVVANPCMQQIFLGEKVDNLASVPFHPLINQSGKRKAAAYLPCCSNADLLIVPAISGYVGAHTMGCVLAAMLHQQAETILMVDIGTNGELVLVHQGRMAACSTAAGPALEGANIHCGMRGCNGAIDHVWLEDGRISYSVIGDQEAVGICGSGIIDAVAVMLQLSLLNKRGRMSEKIFHISENVFITQDDIRQVQMAKGAIAAGIDILTQHLGISPKKIDRVLLAGAFGTFLNPDYACAVGLLPESVLNKIDAVGNIAGSGAKLLALDPSLLELTDQLIKQIEFIELATIPAFRKAFARNMNFAESNSLTYSTT